MPRIEKLSLPAHALHQRYVAEEAYTDCYSTVVDATVTLGKYVETFYTTWLFRIERWILAWAVDKRSNDAEARWVAHGDRDAFAAWTVEERAPNQLLLRDYLGATRSWFMATPEAGGRTRLYFGSVVTAREDPVTGRREIGRTYRWLLGFHRLYSRALLATAAGSLERGR